ncbi:MAG: hypothetical protein R2880_03030 [Deinococcales bacterium]
MVAARARGGVGSSFFLSIQNASLPLSQCNIYYLGEANDESTLDLAIRHNALLELQTLDANSNDPTEGLRRKLLLNLIPDISVGERLARAFERELRNRGYRTSHIEALPLYILSGAAGRGLVIEVSEQDLSSNFIEVLSEIIVNLQPTF